MDFDSIISLLLILLFFIFPTLLKRLRQKKKTAGPVQAGESKAGKAKKMSLFEKLGEQIREYAQTLEQQAQKGEQPQETYWDHLADDGDVQSPGETAFETEAYTEAYTQDYMAEPVVESPVSATARVMPEREVRGAIPKHGKSGPVAEPFSTVGFCQGKLSPGQLQQAIIWSEILSKPVALRQD